MMKRFLISSCIVGLLLAIPPAMADSLRGQGHSPGIHKQVERGKMVPPGHQKKFLSARHWDHGYSHDHRRDRQWNKRHHKQYGYKDRHGFHDRRDYRGEDRRDHHQQYRSGYHHIYNGYDGRISHEQRVARIIRDTQVLIEASRR